MKNLSFFITLFLEVYLGTFQINSLGASYNQSIQVIPVKPSLESNSVVFRIIFPRPYENKRKNPINIQMRIEGFSLGGITRSNRANTVFNHPEGQSIHVLIDNRPYLSYAHSVEDFFKETQESQDNIVSFAIPFNLNPGQHVIRAFPVLSYGESLKGEGCFKTKIFYFQDRKKIDSLNINLEKPYLTYNEPQGRFQFNQSNPILLDFYLTNCTLSPSSYKVRLSIDQKVISLLTKWVPYYLYGLRRGKHRIKLELIDRDNRLVPGYFNVVEREIIID